MVHPLFLSFDFSGWTAPIFSITVNSKISQVAQTELKEYLSSGSDCIISFFLINFSANLLSFITRQKKSLVRYRLPAKKNYLVLYLQKKRILMYFEIEYSTGTQMSNKTRTVPARPAHPADMVTIS
jgi:hypothetical protein